MSDARGGGVMAIRIQKFEKYYHEIPSIYSSSGCSLLMVCPDMGGVCVYQLEVPETQGGSYEEKYLRVLNLIT